MCFAAMAHLRGQSSVLIVLVQSGVATEENEATDKES
jgi:hypothetical protein